MADTLIEMIDSTSLAAWVQAIASVVAIYWAGRLARKQFEHQQNLQQEAERRAGQQRADSFIALAEVAAREIETGLVVARGGDAMRAVGYSFETYAPHTFEGLTNALNAFPIHDLPSASMVGTAQLIRDGFQHTRKATSDFVYGVREMREPSIETATSYLEGSHRYLTEQIEILRRQRNDISTD